MSDSLLSSSLRYFLAIAEAGSYTGAARTLGMSQPALTAAMNALERELGTTLFLRTARGARLTSTGEELVLHARGLAQRASELRHALSDLEGEPRGKFVIGCHESLGAYFLPGFARRFFPAHPRIEISLWNGNSRDVMDAVVARKVDVGIVVNPAPHPECVIIPLFADRVELLVRVTGRKKRGSAAAPATAADVPAALPLVYVSVLQQTQWILGRLPEDLRARRHLGCSSMELVKSLVVDGAGIGILPRRVASHGLPPGTLSTLASAPGYDDRIALVRRADMHETRAARLLFDALKARGKELEKES